MPSRVELEPRVDPGLDIETGREIAELIKQLDLLPSQEHGSRGFGPVNVIDPIDDSTVQVVGHATRQMDSKGGVTSVYLSKRAFAVNRNGEATESVVGLGQIIHAPSIGWLDKPESLINYGHGRRYEPTENDSVRLQSLCVQALSEVVAS